MAEDVKLLFMYLLDVSTSSFENCLFNLFTNLLISLLVIWVFNFSGSLYILDNNPSWMNIWQNFFLNLWVFFHSVDCFFCCAEVYKDKNIKGISIQQGPHLSYSLLFSRLAYDSV
jgi:hypothetical protein